MKLKYALLGFLLGIIVGAICFFIFYPAMMILGGILIARGYSGSDLFFSILSVVILIIAVLAPFIGFIWGYVIGEKKFNKTNPINLELNSSHNFYQAKMSPLIWVGIIFFFVLLLGIIYF